MIFNANESLEIRDKEASFHFTFFTCTFVKGCVGWCVRNKDPLVLAALRSVRLAEQTIRVRKVWAFFSYKTIPACSAQISSTQCCALINRCVYTVAKHTVCCSAKSTMKTYQLTAYLIQMHLLTSMTSIFSADLILPKGSVWFYLLRLFNNFQLYVIFNSSTYCSCIIMWLY